MKENKKIKSTNNLILIVVLLVALLLRTYDLFSIPFTHDEFSALFRLNFDNFSDLIAYGIRVDGHPAGVHLFLYFWTNIVGSEPWIVKLPFIIMGIMAVYFSYKLGKLWFNETVGLITAAFLASTQFAVMYSQIARPYGSGLFLSLAMVYYWSLLIQKPEKNFLKNLILFVVFGSFCTYNHHFSLLFAGIVGLIGIFFIQRNYLWKYILGGIMVLILYIPHIEIFLYQLSMGGVEGWLAKPENDFILQFIGYIFHYSFYVILLVVLMILIFILPIQSLKLSKPPTKAYLIAGLFFFLPFLIGFFYSKYVNAVLQYSVLIFSFPFLFFLIFGHIGNVKTPIKWGIVSLILVVNSITLIVERNHYSIFYSCHYEHTLLDMENAKKEMGQLGAVIDTRKDIVHYYAQKHNIDTNFRWFDSFDRLIDFKDYVQKIANHKNYFYLGGKSMIDPKLVPIIREYFPEIIRQKNYFTGTTILFKKNEKHVEKQLISILNLLDSTRNYWSNIPSEMMVDTFGLNHYSSLFFDETSEWGPTFLAPISEIINNKNDFIDVSLKVYNLQKINDVLLVISVDDGEKNIHWQGVPIADFIKEQTMLEWFSAHASLKLSDIPKREKYTVKIFIWNKGKKSFFVSDFKIVLRKGNPIIYGLYNPL